MTKNNPRVEMNHPANSVIGITAFNKNDEEDGVGGNIQMTSVGQTKQFSKGKHTLVSEDSIISLAKNSVVQSADKITSIAKDTIMITNDMKNVLEMKGSATSLASGAFQLMILGGPGAVPNVNSSKMVMQMASGGEIGALVAEHSLGITLSTTGIGIKVFGTEINLSAAGGISLSNGASIISVLANTIEMSIGGTAIPLDLPAGGGDPLPIDEKSGLTGADPSNAKLTVTPDEIKMTCNGQKIACGAGGCNIGGNCTIEGGCNISGGCTITDGCSINGQEMAGTGPSAPPKDVNTFTASDDIQGKVRVTFDADPESTYELIDTTDNTVLMSNISSGTNWFTDRVNVPLLVKGTKNGAEILSNIEAGSAYSLPGMVTTFAASTTFGKRITIQFGKTDGTPIPTYNLVDGSTTVMTNVKSGDSWMTDKKNVSLHLVAINSVGETKSNISIGTTLV